MHRAKPPLEPPTDDDDLAVAYRMLCSLANADGVVSAKLARRELTRVLAIEPRLVDSNICHRLRERGYLRALGNVEGERVWKLTAPIIEEKTDE